MEVTTRDHQVEMTGIAGHLNVLHANLVEVIADALASDDWVGPGIHSETQWVAWKTGVSPERALQIVAVARKFHDFPAVMGVFSDGELSLEQVAVVVTAPPWADRDMVDIAKVSTVAQLRRAVRSERFVGDPDEPEPTPVDNTNERLSTHITDDSRWRINGELDLDRGMIVDAALGSAREELFDGGETGITSADCLTHICDRYLDGVTSPVRRDRSKVWIHLDASDQHATTTDGWRIPMAIRDRMLCDTAVQPVWERDGIPFSVGRTQRIVPERTRRIIQLRDRGCRVPGCTHERYVEIHHIIHWLDDGVTDTWNLLSLCPKHHRLHHQGKLGISGNADLPGGVTFTDRQGRVLDPSGSPGKPTGPPPAPRCEYRHPHGGRMDYHWVGLGWIHPNELKRRRERWHNHDPRAMP
jgi:hypothetical protein